MLGIQFKSTLQSLSHIINNILSIGLMDIKLKWAILGEACIISECVTSTTLHFQHIEFDR